MNLREFRLNEIVLVVNDRTGSQTGRDIITVREVSPELDAAYAECERAFEAIKIVTGTSTKQWHIANDALAVIKKARDEK